MQKKLSFVLTLIITMAAICSGQKNLESGYIIKNDGEQVYGLIDIKSNFLNSKTCNFQNQDQGIMLSFTPDDIQGYKTNTKYYMSRDVEIDSTKQKVFLEYLVDGIVDLYYLRGLINEYYFIEKEGQLYRLQNDEMKVLIEGDGFSHNDKIYSGTSNQYKGALNYIFSDGKGLSQKVSQTPFNYRSLINLTKDYHNAVCTEYECIDFTRSTAQKLQLELSAGMVYTQMSLKTSGTHEQNLRPSLTAQLRFVPLKSNSNWIFLLGLGYSSNDFHGYFDHDLYAYSQNYTFDLAEKYVILRIPLNIQYELGSGKLRPFISGGYSACFYIAADYASYKNYDHAQFAEISRLRKYQHGFTGGLGLNINLNEAKYLFIKANFEYRIPSANLHYVFDYVRHQSVMINFGYAFGL